MTGIQWHREESARSARHAAAGREAAPARQRTYRVPWRQVAGLTPHILHGTRQNLRTFVAQVVAGMDVPPRVEGRAGLPLDPRFLLVANHYQRKGLWILHPAALITREIGERYPELETPMHWVVTANWPAWRLGRWKFPSPGDILLPRVAHALSCYAIPFAGADPRRTASSLYKLLKDARTLDGPVGLFPEGVAGTAGRLSAPLDGTGRFIARMARMGRPAVPVAIWEEDALCVRFGTPIPTEELLGVPDPALRVMAEVGRMLEAHR